MAGELTRKETTNQEWARGLDTQARIPVFAAGLMLVSMLFSPWVSMPELKYSPYPHTASLGLLPSFPEGIAWKYPVPDAVTDMGVHTALWLKAAMWIGVVLCALFILAACFFKVRSVLLGRIVFFYNGILCLAAFAWVTDTNSMLNILEGRPNSFINLTIASHLQLTAWAYGQLLSGLILIPFLRSLLDTRKEYKAECYITRYERADKGFPKRTALGFFLMLFAIPAVIFFGIYFLNDRSEYFISLCIVILSMVPFFLVFEDRRPQAREIVVIAVMAALAVTGRVAFFMLPHFKPMAAVVIIAGISLGAESGFLTGALSGFVSNFFFGQGPWTPWQMFSYGIVGFLAGLIFRRKRGKWKHFNLWVCVYGGLSALVIYGGIMDASGILSGVGEGKWQAFLALCVSGLPLNAIHGTATVIFLWVLGEPMMKKLDRVKKKYGLLEP